MKLTQRFALGVLLAAAPAAVMTAAIHPTMPPPAAPVTSEVPHRAAQDPIYKPGNGVTDPVPVRQAEPKYTTQAMKEKIEGVVMMEAVILPNGTVGTISVTQSLDAKYGLDQEAIKAAKQWKFRPSTKDGQPVSVRVTIEMSFRLHKSPFDPSAVQAAPAGRARGGGAGSPTGVGATTPAYSSEEMRQRIVAASQTAVDDFVKGTYPEDTPSLVAPKPTYTPEPKYTAEAMRAKIQGVVIIEAVFGTDGLVSRARVAQSLDKDYGLDNEALTAAKQWRFEPGTLNGERVPVLVKLTLSFRLHTP